jgi:hypothetical protein
MWFLAGVFTTLLSLDSPGRLPDLSFPMKVGGIWAAVGFVLVVALPTWFNMSLERSRVMRREGTFRADPMRVALQSTAARAVLLGAGAGFALARWAIPTLDLPNDLAFSNSPETWGAVLTAVAYLICVPVAAGVAARMR